jgi:predicted dithiol-disulfide oxidoreductase (DUF899 family)
MQRSTKFAVVVFPRPSVIAPTASNVAEDGVTSAGKPTASPSQFLDRAPRGRNETRGWLHRPDEY